jgi:hypothetical protein
MRRRSKVISTLAITSQVVGALVLVALTTGQGHVEATSTSVADGTGLRAAVTAVNPNNGQDDTITLTSTGPYILNCGTNEDSNTDGGLDLIIDVTGYNPNIPWAVKRQIHVCR